MSINTGILRYTIGLMDQLKDETHAYPEVNRLYEEITQNYTEMEKNRFLYNWNGSENRKIEKAIQFVANSTFVEVKEKDKELRKELQQISETERKKQQTLLASFQKIKYQLEVERDRAIEVIRKAERYIEQTTSNNVNRVRNMRAQMLRLLRTEYEPRIKQVTETIENLQKKVQE